MCVPDHIVTIDIISPYAVTCHPV